MNCTQISACKDSANHRQYKTSSRVFAVPRGKIPCYGTRAAHCRKPPPALPPTGKRPSKSAVCKTFRYKICRRADFMYKIMLITIYPPRLYGVFFISLQNITILQDRPPACARETEETGHSIEELLKHMGMNNNEHQSGSGRHHHHHHSYSRRHEPDTSEIFKRQSLLSIKRRKMIGKILFAVLSVFAALIIAACILSTI